MKISGIYQIQSKIKPERIYIGSSVNITERWRHHKDNLSFKKHHNRIIQNHYNKYGEFDLQFSVLLGCDKKDLVKNEQFFIDSLNPYFNIRKIAESNIGIKRTTEFCKKQSESRKGRISPMRGKHLTEEQKEHLRKINTGKKQSIESINKRAEKRRGVKRKPFSDEWKRHISESHKGLPSSKKGKHYDLKEETLNKMSERMKGKKLHCTPHSEETRQKIREKRKLQIFSHESIQKRIETRRSNRLKKIAS